MFGIENSKDRLAILEEDFCRLRQNPLDISLAEKTCSDAWHLVDWVFSESKNSDKNITLEKSRNDLYSECPEMKVLHDLANAYKHKTLTHPKVKIIRDEVHAGGFSSSGFSKAFNTSRLTVYFEDNSKMVVDDLIRIAIKYWKKKII